MNTPKHSAFNSKNGNHHGNQFSSSTKNTKDTKDTMNIKRRSSHHRRNRTTTDLPLDLLNLNTNLINEEEDADHPGLGPSTPKLGSYQNGKSPQVVGGQRIRSTSKSSTNNGNQKDTETNSKMRQQGGRGGGGGRGGRGGQHRRSVTNAHERFGRVQQQINSNLDFSVHITPRKKGMTRA